MGSCVEMNVITYIYYAYIQERDFLSMVSGEPVKCFNGVEVSENHEKKYTGTL